MNPAWEWQTPPLTVKTPIVFREFVTEWLLKKKNANKQHPKYCLIL